MTKKSAKQFSLHALISGCALSLLILGFSTACDTESANSVSRSLGDTDVSGVYSYDSGECSSQQSEFISVEPSISSFDLRQTGDQIEVITDTGQIFRGTIGRIVDNIASFNLEGFDPEGNAVIISGTINGSGVMSATWIEDSIFGTVCGSASGVIIDDTPEPTPEDVTISPQSPSVGLSDTQEFSASGGDGANYSWSISAPGLGSIDDNGTTATYSSNDSSGSQTVSVSSGGQTDSVTFTQQ